MSVVEQEDDESRGYVRELRGDCVHDVFPPAHDLSESDDRGSAALRRVCRRASSRQF